MPRCHRTYDWTAIRTFYESGHHASECQARFGISNGAWHAAVKRGDVVLRETRTKPRSATREAVAWFFACGLSLADIAKEVGVSKPTVSYHLRRLGIAAKVQATRRYDWGAVCRYYEEGHSATECRDRFGFGRNAWADAIARGVIRARPRLEPIDKVLDKGRRRSRHHVKLRLIQAGLKAQRCESCGLSEWRDRPIALQLHHVNGDGFDNRLGNLRLLCPNCHSQTENWGVRNRRHGTAA